MSEVSFAGESRMTTDISTQARKQGIRLIFDESVSTTATNL